MKSFRFKLQTALDYKITLEEKKKMELAMQQQEVHQAENDLQEVLRAMVMAEQDARKHETGYFDVERRQLFFRFWEFLEQRQHQAERRLKLELEQLEDIRKALLSLMQERKVLENLREKHLLQYKQELERAEQKILDEIALNSYIRTNDNVD